MRLDANSTLLQKTSPLYIAETVMMPSRVPRTSRRGHRLTARLGLALALALTASACGGSKPSIEGHLSLRSKVTVPLHAPDEASARGTFTTSGALDDSGSVIDRYRMVGERHLVEHRTYTGRHGTIVVKVDVRVAVTRLLSGTWQIESGTGDYENLSGEGTVSGSLHDIGATGGTLIEDELSGEVTTP